MAELSSILMTRPVTPRLSPLLGRQLIERNVLDSYEVVVLSDADYAAVIAHLGTGGIMGGATYDALILSVALKIDIDQILTLNTRDFRRMYPSLIDKIVEP